jgi:hypothetical protein
VIAATVGAAFIPKLPFALLSILSLYGNDKRSEKPRRARSAQREGCFAIRMKNSLM